jgi:predicted RNA-binding protein with TRAM domain
MNGRGFRNPPVQVGEEIDVKIEAVGEKGDGIAKKNGFVLFVPGVKEGDEVRIKITKVLRKVGFAEVIGSAQGEVEQSEPRESSEEESAEQAPAEEEPSEDTEDFGEELEEKD